MCGVPICILIKQNCTSMQGKFSITRFNTTVVSEAWPI